MNDPEHPREGLAASVRQAAAKIMELVRTRLELFGVELRLEQSRLLECLVLAVVLAALVLLGIMVLSVALVLRFWEEHRVAALCGLGLAYLVGAACAILRLRRRLGEKMPFGHTLEELKKDTACLDDPKDSN